MVTRLVKPSTAIMPIWLASEIHDAAVARTSVIREKTLTEIQRVIDRMKTSPSYTE